MTFADLKIHCYTNLTFVTKVNLNAKFSIFFVKRYILKFVESHMEIVDKGQEIVS